MLLLPLSLPSGYSTECVCDTWPLRGHTYGYLLSPVSLPLPVGTHFLSHLGQVAALQATQPPADSMLQLGECLVNK